MQTYECNPMVKSLEEVCDIGELKRSQPAMLINSQLIIKDHDEAGQHISSSDATKPDQGFLSDADPWRVAHAKKDGLIIVSIGRSCGLTDVRDHPSCDPLGEEK